MSIIREPRLRYAAIKELHPTQITVGMREVDQKREQWRSDGKKKRAKVLGRHLVPVILGPKDRYYVIDHHHLVRALHDEGVKDVLVTVLENLSGLTSEAFWRVLDNRSLTHPYDSEGHRRTYDAVPRSFRDLIDDPFRSLASELRRVGGFAKQTMPFSEFLWADFLRPQIDRKLIEGDFARAVEKALKLAKAPAANYLPGWCGPVPEERE
jgi:hypothetical protein